MGSSNIHFYGMSVDKNKFSSDSTDLDEDGYSKEATKKLIEQLNVKQRFMKSPYSEHGEDFRFDPQVLRDMFLNEADRDPLEDFRFESQVIRNLLVSKADPNARDCDSRSLFHYLHLIEDKDKMSMMQLLISSKADVNTVVEDSFIPTSFHSILQDRFLNAYTPQLVEKFFEADVCQTKKNSFGQTPLMFLGGIRKSYIYSGKTYELSMINRRDGFDVHYSKVVTLFVQRGIGLDEVIKKWQEDPKILFQRRAYLKGLQEQVLLFVAVSSLVQMIVDYTLDDEEILKKIAQREQQICEVWYC